MENFLYQMELISANQQTPALSKNKSLDEWKLHGFTSNLFQTLF